MQTSRTASGLKRNRTSSIDVQKKKKGTSPFLGQGVTTVNAELRTGDVFGSVAEQEGNGTHEILRGSHLARRNEGNPLLSQFRVLVEDLAGSKIEWKI